MKITYGFKKENNEFVVEETQANVVRKIFELYLDGYSLGDISKHLEENNILSPTGKSAWNRASIEKMLSNKSTSLELLPLKLTLQFNLKKKNALTQRKITKERPQGTIRRMYLVVF